MEPVERTDSEWADDARADREWVDDEWESVFAAIVADGPHDSGAPDDGAPHTSGLDDAQGLALVRTLRDVDPDRLGAADAVSYLQATERAIAWLSALQADALVAIAGPRSRTDHYEIPDAPAISIEDADRSEIAAATRWSEPWAHERVTAARLLAGPLADTASALRAGTITSRHADAICAAAQRLAGYGEWADGADLADPADPAVRAFRAACTALEDAVLEGAKRRGVAATRKAVERALLRIDAANVAQRRKAERRNRDVYLVPEPDGMALLIARMGLAQAQACLSVITGVAGDPRLPLSAGTPADAGIGERRAEALTHLILRGATQPVAEGETGQPAGSPTHPAAGSTAHPSAVSTAADRPPMRGRRPRCAPTSTS